MSDRIRNLTYQTLSDNWYHLRKYTFDFLGRNGEWQRQEREAYDRGNGAAVLLYNRERGTVLLTRQFRLPSYVNGNPSGLLIEVCAGILDTDDPEEAIRKEMMEELGYAVDRLEKVFEAYMSPGSVTEILHFFVGEYSAADRVSEGGGVADEQEEIEVLEVPLIATKEMLASGKIRDGKTIMLLQWAYLHLSH